jgi:hypothetical protein
VAAGRKGFPPPATVLCRAAIRRSTENTPNLEDIATDHVFCVPPGGIEPATHGLGNGVRANSALHEGGMKRCFHPVGITREDGTDVDRT